MYVDDFERRYGFPLDAYQREAIGHLQAGNSVLVAAPTGSGKTVIAEYALEKARAEGLKFFYTAPIKALSNQKYRDLCEVYRPGEVGLLTGDNSINAEAPLVVMTTEVLRNMIYEGSDLLRSLGFVVLDEVHYMQDPFRGGVWEEIVILLPADVKLVALSATVSNAAELADWMNSLRGGLEVVVSSERPVKLKNFYFAGRALTPLFSKNLPRVISDQLEIAKSQQARHGGRRRGGADLRPRRADVIRELGRRQMLPAIYFLFSRAACDDSVKMCLSKGVDLTGPRQKRQIAEYLDEKVAYLDRADLDCLDYGGVRDALSAGIAAHHAGLLPLFKEAVEELFSRGLINVVFATETLSLGINMPARSVVIESLSKWDGDRHRPMTPGEYKQLTGRAGRRGIDEVGYSVVLHQRYFSVDQVRALVSREPYPVVSSFEVSYNMAVNLLADHDLEECQRLLNLSFAQYAADRRVVTLEARLETLDRELDAQLLASRCDEADATRYRQLEKEQSSLSGNLASLTKERRRREIKDAMARLQPGDVFLMGRHGESRVLAVVRKHRGKSEEAGVLAVDPSGRYRRLTPGAIKHPPRVIGAVEVSKITSPTKKVRRSVGDRMESLRKGAREEHGPLPSDEEDRLRERLDVVREDLEKHPCRSCEHNRRCLEAARKVEKTGRQIEGSKKERDSGHDVVSRRLADVIEVLNEFGFLEGIEPTPKGEMLRRVYNECDLLLVTALDEGALARLEPRELVALASWFIYESREGDEEDQHRRGAGDRAHLQGPLDETLTGLDGILDRMKEAEARRGLDLLGTIDTGFGEEAYAWGGGAELEEMLVRFPDRSVGDLVRTMKQMIDLMRQLAEVSPDPVLTANLRVAMDMVDRGVVGYSSLESIIEHTA